MTAKRHKPIGNWAKALKELRARLGNLSQTEMAERIHVSQSIWSSWERGEKVPSPSIQLLIQFVFKDSL